ncbi:MAG: hypothetical protein JRF47_00915 [Deltaproteobacteria bacterium]|nr:hypothetical protein [Deltaproteobacteria bacterium]
MSNAECRIKVFYQFYKQKNDGAKRLPQFNLPQADQSTFVIPKRHSSFLGPAFSAQNRPAYRFFEKGEVFL